MLVGSAVPWDTGDWDECSMPLSRKGGQFPSRKESHCALKQLEESSSSLVPAAAHGHPSAAQQSLTLQGRLRLGVHILV